MCQRGPKATVCYSTYKKYLLPFPPPTKLTAKQLTYPAIMYKGPEKAREHLALGFISRTKFKGPTPSPDHKQEKTRAGSWSTLCCTWYSQGQAVRSPASTRPTECNYASMSGSRQLRQARSSHRGVSETEQQQFR